MACSTLELSQALLPGIGDQCYNQGKHWCLWIVLPPKAMVVPDGHVDAHVLPLEVMLMSLAHIDSRGHVSVCGPAMVRGMCGYL